MNYEYVYLEVKSLYKFDDFPLNSFINKSARDINTEKEIGLEKYILKAGYHLSLIVSKYAKKETWESHIRKAISQLESAKIKSMKQNNSEISEILSYYILRLQNIFDKNIE